MNQPRHLSPWPLESGPGRSGLKADWVGTEMYKVVRKCSIESLSGVTVAPSGLLCMKQIGYIMVFQRECVSGTGFYKKQRRRNAEGPPTQSLNRLVFCARLCLPGLVMSDGSASQENRPWV